MKRSKRRPISREIDGGGWVKLHRKALDSDVFAVPELWHLFSWCLLSANHTTRHVPIKIGRGRSVRTVGPGQFIYGRKSKAKELGLPESTLSDRMKRLEAMEAISIQADTTNSIVTIVNWGLYQRKGGEGRHPSNMQPTAKQRATDAQATAIRQPTDTNNKGEKGKKGEKVKNGEKAKVDEASRDDHRSNRGVWGELENETRRLANEVAETVGVNPANRPHDRSVILKASFLVTAGIMPEAWLRDAVEAVKQGRHKNNKPAYFHRCLAAGAERLGKNLNRLLAAECKEIPADVLAGDGATNKPARQDCAPCVPEGQDDRQDVSAPDRRQERLGGPDGVAG